MAIDSTAATTLTRRRAQEDSALVRGSLIALAALVLGILVVVPLVNVF